MYKMYTKIKMILAVPMTLLLISLFSLPALAANPAQVIDHVNTSSKVIALTFDDCTSTTQWTAILDVLGNYGIKATFFPTGQGAESNVPLIERAYNYGDQIGNHSYSHPYLTGLTYSGITSQADQTDTIIKNITGKSPKPYFRPPYGDYNAAVLQALGDDGYSKAIMWTVDSDDYDGISADQITKNVLNNASPGTIVLMHAGSFAPGTPGALPTIISTLKADGYKFVTIDELLAYQGSATPTIPSTGTNYTVKPGDTLGKIAAAYGLTVQALAIANDISNINVITVSQLLTIPANTSSSTSGTKYTVKSGDTLGKVAAAYGVTVQAIANANGISNVNVLSVGKVLTIPAKTSSSGTKYTVKSGDTLGKIAAAYRVTVQALANANSIANVNVVRVGQVLVIP